MLGPEVIYLQHHAWIAVYVSAQASHVEAVLVCPCALGVVIQSTTSRSEVAMWLCFTTSAEPGCHPPR